MMKRITCFIKSQLKSVLLISILILPVVLSAQIDTVGFKVVLLVADDDFRDDVENKLDSSGYFGAVDVFSVKDSTPTLEYLKNYDAALIYSDDDFYDAKAIGDTLAEFINDGGALVDAVFENASIQVEGALDSAKYRVLMPESQAQGSIRTLGAVLLPGHFLMNGVKSFDGGSGSYRSTSDSLAQGAFRVANYDNDEILIAARDSVGLQFVKRVSLNFFPPSSLARNDFWDANTDGARIMANALTWASGAYISGIDTALADTNTVLTFNAREDVSVIKWQKKFESEAWSDILTTDGVIEEAINKAGNWRYRILYKNGIDTNYTANHKLFVKSSQSIRFDEIPILFAGNDTLKLMATASSGLPVTYSSRDTSVAIIRNDTVFCKKPGTSIITASQAGNEDYFAADDVSQTLKMRIAAGISLTATSGTYNGTAISATATTDPVGLNYIITYNGSSTNPENAGTYEVVAEIEDAMYYAVDSGEIIIGKAELTITADDKTREAGKGNPSFTMSYSGFLGDDSESDLDVLPYFECEATKASSAGEYDIVVLGGNDTNYKFNCISGTLTVTRVSSTDFSMANNVFVYPNPAQDYITIKNSKATAYRITNLAGAVVGSGYSEDNNIDVSMLKNGVYVLEMDELRFRIIKQ